MNVNDKVFDFSLMDHLGNTVSQESFIGNWSIIYFYPKDSTPGCTTESCDFRDNLPDFEKADAKIFGVSKDSEKSHIKFATKQSLNFPLIIDTEGVLLEGFGTWQLKKNYGKEYMGIVRSTFIINPEGVVVKKYEKVRVKEHVKTVLNDLKEMQSA